jgi:hypothetical protein
MGNYMEIAAFISSAGARAETAMKIMEYISAKDLRDTPAEVLADHLVNAPDISSYNDTELFYRYVLSPRIANELLSPFRSAIKKMPSDLMEMFRTHPESAARWIDTALTITETDNYYGTPVIPAGVLKLHTADPHSRDIFFVALCRTAGVPARLAPGTDRPQYYSEDEWHDVRFAGDTAPAGEYGWVTFSSETADHEPEYHIHFSLAHIISGHYQTLDYDYGRKISDMPGSIKLISGDYMLTTGNRDENGNVFSSLTFFTLGPGEEKKVVVAPRPIPETEITRGRADLSGKLMSYSGDSISLDTLSRNGLVLIWLEPGTEPTRHLLNDLPTLGDEYNRWDGYFVFLTDPSANPAGNDHQKIAGMPYRSVFAEDSKLAFMTSILGDTSANRPLPVVLCCDQGGNISFFSEGYRIGTGEQILKKIR